MTREERAAAISARARGVATLLEQLNADACGDSIRGIKFGPQSLTILEAALATVEQETREAITDKVQRLRLDLPVSDGIIAHSYDAAINDVLAALRSPDAERR